jgi:hypothetical protein
MPAVWLRGNCPCPLCRDPVTFGYRDAAAYRALAELLSAPPSMLTVRLRPGDCAVGDRATTGVTRRKDRI